MQRRIVDMKNGKWKKAMKNGKWKKARSPAFPVGLLA